MLECIRRTSLLLLGLALLAPASIVAADGYSGTLPGTRPSRKGATAVRAVPDEQQVAITIGLSWRNQAELDQLLREIASPQSGHFESYLTTREFDTRFAPKEEDIAALVAHLEANEFLVERVSPDRLLVTARGPARAVTKAFGTRLLQYQDGEGTFVAPESDPRLPPSIGRNVLSIQGLDSDVVLRSRAVVAPPQLQPHDGSLPYWTGHIAAAYNLEQLYEDGIRGDTSRAATIGVLTALGFDRKDLGSFWDFFGIERTQDSVEVVEIGGPTEVAELETTLDVEWATSLAPGSPVIVYQGASSAAGTFLEVYNQAVHENRAAVLTTSWGACEKNLPESYLEQAHAIFQKAAALGISVIAASGDNGARDCGPATLGVDFPASDPYVTAVGGTSLRMLGDRYANEDAWEGSGGGVSERFDQPLWQAEPNGRRALPDVALNADPGTPYWTTYNGQWWTVGGTSVAAPVWAAIVALSNQQRARMDRSTIGLTAPRLCELNELGMKVFRDITRGDNGGFSAKVGWDYVTGWGSPDAWKVAQALSHYTPPTSVDAAETVAATALPIDGSGRSIARARFKSRCANAVLEINAYLMEPGTYDVLIDNRVVHSFEATTGVNRMQLATLDPRGKSLMLLRRDSAVCLEAAFPNIRRHPVAVIEHLAPPSGSIGRGFVRFRSRNGTASFAVRAYDLPARRYELSVGGTVVGSFDVRRGGTRSVGIASFDTRGLRGAPMGFDPLCQRVTVGSRGVDLLVIEALGAERGLCGEQTA